MPSTEAFHWDGCGVAAPVFGLPSLLPAGPGSPICSPQARGKEETALGSPAA